MPHRPVRGTLSQNGYGAKLVDCTHRTHLSTPAGSVATVPGDACAVSEESTDLRQSAGRGCAFLSPKWGLAGGVQAAVLCPVVRVDGLP